jgi:hypothetical protein
MAKQCGPVYFEKTWDDLVFYKLCGEYYARVKSTLTAKRVKTSAEFARTMYSANRMARASKIGSAIYRALPPGWRQFWMYRSFTGEAFLMLKTELYTEGEVEQALRNSYVEYWNKWGEANKNNPALQTILKAKAKKVRRRRQWKLESLLRQKDKYGKPKWRNPEEEDHKRLKKERNDAAYATYLATQKHLSEQEQQTQASQTQQQTALLHQAEMSTAIPSLQLSWQLLPAELDHAAA